MFKALQNGDLKTFVMLYNGPGKVDSYTKALNVKTEIYNNTK